PLRTTKKIRRAPAARIFSSRYCETALGRPRSASGSRCTPIGSSSLLQGSGASRVARPAAAITPTTGVLRSEDMGFLQRSTGTMAPVRAQRRPGTSENNALCSARRAFVRPFGGALAAILTALHYPATLGHTVHSMQRLPGFGCTRSTIGSTLQPVDARTDARTDARQARSATRRRSRSGIRQGGAVSGTLPVVPPDGPATRADL